MDRIGIVTGPHADDLAPLDAQFHVVVRLARNFTGVTLDAAIEVEIESNLYPHSL
jgi:hypothetical protein